MKRIVNKLANSFVLFFFFEESAGTLHRRRHAPVETNITVAMRRKKGCCYVLQVRLGEKKKKEG